MIGKTGAGAQHSYQQNIKLVFFTLPDDPGFRELVSFRFQKILGVVLWSYKLRTRLSSSFVIIEVHRNSKEFAWRQFDIIKASKVFRLLKLRR